jgi:hypothetical protein
MSGKNGERGAGGITMMRTKKNLLSAQRSDGFGEWKA